MLLPTMLLCCAVQLVGGGSPLLFGGMTEALLAALKQNISDAASS